MEAPNDQAGLETTGTGTGTQVPFEAIDAPGTYVCNWSGHLLRVPADAIKPGRSPLMCLIGTKPLYVSKISGDPFIQVGKARLLAANFDVPVNF